MGKTTGFSLWRIVVFFALLVMCSACANTELDTDIDKMRFGKSAIDMEALPIALNPAAPQEEKVGKLVYRGGLYLKSRDKRFGGLSGLLVSADGRRILAVSDAGYWFRAQLDYKDSRLVGLRKADLAPMLDLNGLPLSGKTEADAEALASAGPDGPDGDVYASFERDNRIWLYPFGRDGFKAVPQEVPAHLDIPKNVISGGVKGLVDFDTNALLAMSEDVRDRMGDHMGWLIPVPPMVGRGGYGVVFLKADRDYRVTGLTLLPDGDLLVLERSFSLELGAGMQLRRVKHNAVAPLRAFNGDVLANLDVRYSIDNMEAVAARQGANGDTLIYVLSDDNYNGLQRTVLLMFALEKNGSVAAQPAAGANERAQ
jgi:hypothetical protein